jgi:NADH-quinone oxidoreductase subunit J
VSDIAAKLFHDYVFAFELTSALLITAAVGAMVLAHVERPRGQRASQKDLARQRFQGGRPSPLPGPGVFATSDSIATPALLPDGTVAPGSVSHLVEPNLTGANLTGAMVPAGVRGGADVVGTATPVVSLPGSRPEVDPIGISPTDTAAPGSSGRQRGATSPPGAGPEPPGIESAGTGSPDSGTDSSSGSQP